MENVFHISDPNTDINGRGGDKISLDSLEPLKRPPNSFVLYKLHFGKIVSPELMSDQRKMNVEAAKYWRLMTEEEKGIWKDKANELWEEWRIESSKRPRIVVPAAAPKPPPTPAELWDMERRKWRRPRAAIGIPVRSGSLREDHLSASSPYPCTRERSRSTRDKACQGQPTQAARYACLSGHSRMPNISTPQAQSPELPLPVDFSHQMGAEHRFRPSTFGCYDDAIHRPEASTCARLVPATFGKD